MNNPRVAPMIGRRVSRVGRDSRDMVRRGEALQQHYYTATTVLEIVR